MAGNGVDSCLSAFESPPEKLTFDRTSFFFWREAASPRLQEDRTTKPITTRSRPWAIELTPHVQPLRLNMKPHAPV